jgi:predicted Na+-dependent transporter
MFLILLLPAAVSSPAFSTFLGGKPDLSLKILLYSSFFSVIGIPVLSRLFLGSSSGLNASGLLVTLVWTILLPFLLHLPVRKIRPVREFMLKTNSLITLISLSVMSVLVTAQNKEIILGHLPDRRLCNNFVIMYLLMYLAGYYL